MHRYALILAVAGVLAACILGVRPAGAACDPANPQSFVASIQVLKPGYIPRPGTAAYRPPTGQALNLPATSPIVVDLLNAFANAPLSFRAKLCGSAGVSGLSGIFINATGCAQNDPTRCTHTVGGASFNRAWGFRNRTFGSPDFGAMFVAIAAADLWQNGAAARFLNQYEAQLLGSFPGPSGASVAPATPNDPWMSVLAALAHEVGHINWAETAIPVIGGGYNFGLLIGCPYGDFFTGWNYDHSASNHFDLQPPNRWRPFRNRGNESGFDVDHSSAPFLDDLDDPATANQALYDLLQPSQPWASLFGAQTPDEDFVESYVMAVLTGYDPIADTFGRAAFTGPLRNLPITVGALGSRDVADDLVMGRKPALLNKIRCVPL